MGLETKTFAIVGRNRYPGKLHLDSNSLTFTGRDYRWAADLGKSTTARANEDLLIIQKDGKSVAFEIGPAADRWVQKVLNPPDRLTKLGVKSGQKLWLSKGFSRSFIAELRQHGASIVRQIEKGELAFWKVTNRQELDEFRPLAARLPEGVNLWIVWTKGTPAISQKDVMSLARELGFGPGKTAAFDGEHSSMRFARKK